MSLIEKPMLAVTCENVKNLAFPVLATPKLDGIRCVIIDGKALSRKFKEIPNRSIFVALSQLPSGLDGEIMIPGETFNNISSAVMSEDGEPTFEYWVFDYVTDSLDKPYKDRMEDLKALNLPQFVRKLIPQPINNVDDLSKFEALCLSEGYEGVMVRSPNGPYKCNRSTVKEGFLLKIKKFKDSEAVVIGFEERMHNANEATKDELGHTKRSSHKANLVPAGTLGNLKVKDGDIEFDIGTGFDDALRQEIWDNREKYLGKLVKYKSQEVGKKDKPRFPVFLGFRDERDM